MLQQRVVEIKKKLRETGFIRLAVLEKELELGLVREIDYLDYLISCHKLEQDERLAKEELSIQVESLRQGLGLEYGTQLVVKKSG